MIHLPGPLCMPMWICLAFRLPVAKNFWRMRLLVWSRPLTRLFSRILALVACSTFIVTPIAKADVGPPVKIVMPVETAVPAVAGQE